MNICENKNLCLEDLLGLEKEYIKKNKEQIKRVYDVLEDDKSRWIFLNRMLFNYTGNYEYVKELGKTNNYLQNVHPYAEFYSKCKKVNETGGRLIWYGVGELLKNQFEIYGEERCYNYQLFQSIDWECFCDKSKLKVGTSYMGYKIISVEELLEEYKDAYVVLGTYSYNEEIKEELLKLNYPMEHIFEWPKEGADAYVAFDSRHQYFEDDVIMPMKDECFMDCGCYLCDTTLNFLKWNPNYKEIVAFEPEPEQYEKCVSVAKIEKIERIRIIQGGVSEHTGKMGICKEGGGSNLIEGEDVPVWAISDVDIEKVTFIKMDIEGEELAALKGAEKVIKRDRPRLAICIYHRRKDPVEIAEYLLNLNMGYKLFIRHYSNFGLETVLYAI